MSKIKSFHAYTDGADRHDWEAAAYKRRAAMTGDKVVKKIMAYLKQFQEILDLDLRRYRKVDDKENYIDTKKRLAWVEGMIQWINHNV